jgi:hypothetical protein
VEAAAEARSHDVRPETEVRIDVASAAILTLLADREPGATICPSKVARKIAGARSANYEADWRTAMPIVHAAVDNLVDQKNISLSWKGRALSARSGPYRIARANGSLWTAESDLERPQLGAFLPDPPRNSSDRDMKLRASNSQLPDSPLLGGFLALRGGDDRCFSNRSGV